MKILFVSTQKNADPELYELDFLIDILGYQRSLVDLGILTAAAATPARFQIQMIDEYVEDIPWDTDADLVALSAKTSCAPHAYSVADKFRAKGKKVVLGGIHGSLRTEEALQHVDYVVKGEADVTWPAFLDLFEKGQAPQVMADGGYPPMDAIPIPRWATLPHGSFMFHQLQTTRGCPFMCRFCSVPTISGNTFSNWTCGSNAVTCMSSNFGGTGTVVSGNTFSSIVGFGNITGINIGNGNGGSIQTYSDNIIFTKFKNNWVFYFNYFYFKKSKF